MKNNSNIKAKANSVNYISASLTCLQRDDRCDDGLPDTRWKWKVVFCFVFLNPKMSVNDFLPVSARLSHDWCFPELPYGQRRPGYDTHILFWLFNSFTHLFAQIVPSSGLIQLCSNSLKLNHIISSCLVPSPRLKTPEQWQIKWKEPGDKLT